MKVPQGECEHGSDILLKSRIKANKPLICFFLFDFVVKWGASISD